MMLMRLSDVPPERYFRPAFVEVASGNPLVDWLARYVNRWGWLHTFVEASPAADVQNLIQQLVLNQSVIQQWGLGWDLFLHRFQQEPVLSIWDTNFGPMPDSPTLRPQTYVRIEPHVLLDSHKNFL